MPDHGALVLVVGPSGAGKDTVMSAARRRLATETRVVFVRRFITRPAGAGGEPHIGISTQEFTAAAENGHFALKWQAHGLLYGIPVSIDADLQAGRTLIANVSRTVVQDARRRPERVVVAHVTAGPAIRAARLARRGRETEADIRQRLERGDLAAPTGPDVVTIDNGGALETAVSRFVALVRGVAGIDPPSFR